MILFIDDHIRALDMPDFAYPMQMAMERPYNDEV